MKKAQYICIEGTEGVGKGTQTQALIDYLVAKGFKVLHTKEPGTHHLPLTNELRGIMLNNKYEKPENVQLLITDLQALLDNPKYKEQMTETAKDFIQSSLDSIKAENKMSLTGREFVSQAIRSIHLEKLIRPSLHQYDFIIQDRGILSGMAYGQACGNPIQQLRNLASTVVEESKIRPRSFIRNFCISIDLTKEYSDTYDHIIILEGDPSFGLKTAAGAKQEFGEGDAMELKGNSFMEQTAQNFQVLKGEFECVTSIQVHETKEIEDIQDSGLVTRKQIVFRDKADIFNDICKALGV